MEDDFDFHSFTQDSAIVRIWTQYLQPWALSMPCGHASFRIWNNFDRAKEYRFIVILLWFISERTLDFNVNLWSMQYCAGLWDLLFAKLIIYSLIGLDVMSHHGVCWQRQRHVMNISSQYPGSCRRNWVYRGWSKITMRAEMSSCTEFLITCVSYAVCLSHRHARAHEVPDNDSCTHTQLSHFRQTPPISWLWLYNVFAETAVVGCYWVPRKWIY